ncbi:unnamed protein product [Adineta steineri]|uniref:Kinesin light chain n=1 Tax=Adineta steineri TaxID=433720 RepID=A0A815FAC1_9BILA|nr:unnamed protein product [Adineta steineri]CAF4101129.1 unnamed protein product [Adineta steineri]
MASTNDMNQLESSFMYTKLFKEILLDMKHDEQVINQFAAYCRQHDYGSARNIDEFEKDYPARSAIWWYTCPSFIYSMLNYALRSMEGDTIINMVFFIHDLHQQIQQLYQQQVNSYQGKSFIVYRGQGLSKANFKKLQQTQGGLLSFNNFLSTSIEQDISLAFARSASETVDMVGILFKMLIDPRIKSVPFASIRNLSAIEDEDEILFSMHTVFRVGAIKQTDNSTQFYQVELQLSSDDDQQLQLLTARIREDVNDSTGWNRLGNLLLTIAQFDKAEELYNVLLEQTSDEGEKAHYYFKLGTVHFNQGDNKKAISYHEKALEIQRRTLPSNHYDLAESLNDISLVYLTMGEYSKALSFQEKAVEIYEKTLPSIHPDLGTSYHNIGAVYDHMEQYWKALSFYKKALEIRQKTLPSDHPHLGTSYNNIGVVHDHMEQYSEVLPFYKKAYEIRQETLPSNHPRLAILYNNIGMVYSKMGEYSKALSYCEKALKICQKTLPSTHPNLAISFNNIGLVYGSMGEYSKALSYYEKALKICQKTLPSNHPDLAISYSNIGSVYNNMKDYSKALLYYERALDIYQRALPPTNHHIKNVKKSIEIIKKKLLFRKKRCHSVP